MMKLLYFLLSPLLLTHLLFGSSTLVEQGAIGFEFSGVQKHGTYLDGVAWVMGDHVQLLRTTPEETEVDGKQIHGLSVNPKSSGRRNRAVTQSWDERISTYGASPHSYPIALQANDILVKAVGRDRIDKQIRSGVMAQYGAVVVVESPPPANAMAPALIGWEGRKEFKHYEIDLGSIVEALPNFSSLGMQCPSFDAIMLGFDQLNLGLAYTISASAKSGYEAHMPYGFGRRKGPSGIVPFNYGRYTGNVVGSAGLALIVDAYTSEQKMRIAKRMLQHGIQWYDTITNEGTVLVEDGGHFQFHHIPVVCALLWTGREGEIANLHRTMPGNVLGQPLKIDQEILDSLKPHDDAMKPGVSRRRVLQPGSVVGHTITIPTKRHGTQFDPYRLQLVNMFLTRESDGAKARVMDMPKGVKPRNGGSGTLDLIIDQQPAQAFKPGDVVYFTPGYEISIGDYDWSVRNIYPSWYRPNYPISYRFLNFWVEEYFFFKAHGINYPAFETMYGYVERANLPNNPNELIDFPVHYDTPFAQSFWKQHSAQFIKN